MFYIFRLWMYFKRPTCTITIKGNFDKFENIKIITSVHQMTPLQL